MMRNIVALTLWCVCILGPNDLHAKTQRELTYRYNQIWGTVIRFLRVDNGFKIFEKDKSEGYILFEYRDGERKFNSSFELIEVEIEGRHYVRAGLHLRNLPSYVEVLLQDKLKRKLRNEFGDPPAAKLVAPPEKPSSDKELPEETVEGNEQSDKEGAAASEEAEED